MTFEHPSEPHRKYEFERFSKAKSENGNSLDRMMFVISTGIFVLSINYLTGLKDVPLRLLGLLIASWFLLGIAIATHALSYYFAEKHSEFMAKRFDEWGVKQGYKPIEFNPGIENQAQTLIKYTNIMNIMTVTFTIIGVILIIIFASINLILRNEHNREMERMELQKQYCSCVLKN